MTVSSFEDRVARALVQGGFISENQLEQARKNATEKSTDLLETMVSLRFIGRETLMTALAFHLRLPVVDLQRVEVDPKALRCLPEHYAKQHSVLPVKFTPDGSLQVATKTPNDFQLSAQLASVAGRQVHFALALGDGLEKLIDKLYASGPSAPLRSDVEAVGGPVALPAATVGPLAEEVGKLPAVQAVEMVTLQAVKRRASDVHVAPRSDSAQVLFRIDGVLQQMMVLPLTLHESMVSRIKVLAGLDITEKRRPQDGSFSMQFGERSVDFRVATVATIWGEMMVLRVLEQAGGALGLAEVGLESQALHVVREFLRVPHGMFLVSGPTGSGKTTTSYAAVLEVVHTRGNIMTIEDPVEIRMQEVNQIQVNRAAGLDFAAGLKSIMRLDPDVILVGEIRDAETAKTAISAAMTGHLLLGTIHANDAASTIVRLIELGADDYLVAGCMLGTAAQRLVRMVCPRCAEPAELGARESVVYEQEMEEPAGSFMVGRGCNFCGGTGYSGRTGVFEVMAVSEELRKIIKSGADAHELRQRALAEGMIPLRKAGLMKAKQGITTVDEVLRNVFTLE